MASVFPMSALRDLADFKDWWLEQLLGLVPPRVLAHFAQATEPAIRVFVGDGISVRDLQSDQSNEIPFDNLAAEIPAALYSMSPSRPPVVEIVVGEDRLLERKLTDFRLPKRRASTMAMLDIASGTPLKPDAVVCLFPKQDDRAGGHRYFVLKKSHLAPVFAAVGKAAAGISAVKVEVRGQLLEVHADGWTDFQAPNRWTSARSRLTQAGLAACLVATVATFAHAYWRYAGALHEMSKIVEELNADAKEVRIAMDERDRRLSQLKTIRAQKQDNVQLADVWEELTRILPDHSWISELQFDGAHVTIAGLSSASASLISPIESSRLFKGPVFVGPVVKATDAEGDRFTISMEIER
jgi:general secretion pathway protein L